MSRFSRLAPSLALLPFLLYLTVFLLVPTITVVVGAFTEGGRFTLSNITALVDPVTLQALWTSVVLSAVSAVIGAGFGAVLAYLVVTGGQRSWLRRSVTSLSGVLAQCGGVMLAFAFIATIGFSGTLTIWLRDHFGIDIFGSGWLFALPGLILVYSYFQIPLMVIVFLPALDGIKPQWREAVGQPRRQQLAVLDPGRRSRCCGRPSWAPPCCCSPTPSPPTRRPPRWSARATRSCRC